MTTTTEVQTISLATFRAWLSGVEEMSADDWHPTKMQWDRIRQKFDTIAEAAPQPAFQSAFPPGVRTPIAQRHPSPMETAPFPEGPREIPGMVGMSMDPTPMPPPSRMEMPVMMPPSAPIVSGTYKSSFV